MDAGAIPVIVEGPMDAIAITTATNGRYVGAATLGTALSTEQAVQLRDNGVTPIVATDADDAGRAAAHRAYWTLATQLVQPGYAGLPAGEDPAALLADGRLPELLARLEVATPLADEVTSAAIDHYRRTGSVESALATIATQPVDAWEPALALLAKRTGLPACIVHSDFIKHARGFTDNPSLLGHGTHPASTRRQGPAASPPEAGTSDLTAHRPPPFARSSGVQIFDVARQCGQRFVGR